MVKESIRSTSLLQRIEEQYLPRLFFKIYIPFEAKPTTRMEDFTKEDILEDRVPSVVECYHREFKKIFGSSFRKISDTEIEIDFEMESEFLESLEMVIHKDVAVPKQDLYSYIDRINAKPSEEEAFKLFNVVKKEGEQEKKLKKHISLINLYQKWKSQPLIDKHGKVNPCRLAKKVIIHLSFENSEDHNRRLERHNIASTVFCSNKIKKGFLIQTCEEISLFTGIIVHDFNIIYKFITENQTYRKNSLIISYYLLRHKILPRMNQYSIDLKQLYPNNVVNELEHMEPEDVYYYLTVRDNIIKKYRDCLLKGTLKFPQIDKKKYASFNGGIIPEFLIYASLETMNDNQRLHFIKQFLLHIYNSDLLLSDEKRQEFFEKFKIDHRNESFSVSNDSETIKIDFEKVNFKRERAIFKHEVFSFPSFPSNLLFNVIEVTSPGISLTELTTVGKIDSNYRSLFCLNRICGLCNCCAIASCWCATCCCCYSNYGTEHNSTEQYYMKYPPFIEFFNKLICRFEHNYVPMLDCENWYYQFASIITGTRSLDSEYSQMYY